MTNIETRRGDITKITDMDAIVNAHPAAFDKIVWVLFDDRTKAAYDRTLEKL